MGVCVLPAFTATTLLLLGLGLQHSLLNAGSVSGRLASLCPAWHPSFELGCDLGSTSEYAFGIIAIIDVFVWCGLLPSRHSGLEEIPEEEGDLVQVNTGSRCQKPAHRWRCCLLE